MYLADFPAESLFEVYGSTELGVNTVLEPKDQLRKPGSCGKAAPVVEIVPVRRRRQRGRPAPAPITRASSSSAVGSVFADYYKQHDKYEADIRDGYHTVGDIAYRDDEGYLYICDRKKDMIISGGMNIYPAEIEAALEPHPDIYEAAVFGIPSEEWGESVHAVVVVHPEGALVRGRRDGARPRAPGQLQGAPQRLVHGRAAQDRVGQDPQARAARAVLGGPSVTGRLTRRQRSGRPRAGRTQRRSRCPGWRAPSR